MTKEELIQLLIDNQNKFQAEMVNLIKEEFKSGIDNESSKKTKKKLKGIRTVLAGEFQYRNAVPNRVMATGHLTEDVELNNILGIQEMAVERDVIPNMNDKYTTFSLYELSTGDELFVCVPDKANDVHPLLWATNMKTNVVITIHCAFIGNYNGICAGVGAIKTKEGQKDTNGNAVPAGKAIKVQFSVIERDSKDFIIEGAPKGQFIEDEAAYDEAAYQEAISDNMLFEPDI